MTAARDGFRGLDGLADLGATLRAAVDRLCGATLPPERVGPVRAWRRQLDRFEKLARADQEVEVARGLRLCLVIGGPAPPAPPAPPEPLPQRTVSPLAAPVTSLAGIGPVFARAFAERGIETIEDLAWLVPRRYDDLRNVMPLAEAVDRFGGAGEADRVTLAAEIVRVTFTRWRKRFLTVIFRDAVDRQVQLTVRWF